MKIKILDSVYSQMDKESVPIFKELLSYPCEVWRQGPFKKVRKEYTKSFLEKNGLFLTGFLPKICDEAKKVNIKISWEGNIETLETIFPPPSLKGVTLREDQLNIIKQAVDKQRGVILMPTGSGKTLTAIGLISCFPKAKVLFLCHEKTLLSQTYDEMIVKGISTKEIIKFGAGSKSDFKRIVIAMMQSFVKLAPETYCDYFDVIIIDEIHRNIAPGGTYHKILSNMIAPARFGLTATLPQGLDYKLSLEGLIGPVIGQLSLSDGVSLGLLAKPRIKVLKIPYSHKIRELRTYQDVYEQGVVQNQVRNEMIVTATINFIKEKNTVLILVSKIEHGKILADLLKNKQIDVPFVYGNTEEEERKALKNALQRKERPCIIASTVWTTGINIPSLNVLINASGGKSDVATLQKIGRALRTTDEKKTVWIVDCFDQSHPHLISHFAHRFCLYSDEGWV